MTYEELVSKVKAEAAKLDADKITDHLAVQVNIEGEASGAFYIETLAGAINVEPYEYYDNDVVLTCQASQILEILKGDLDPMAALSDGQISAEGNVGRLGLFGEIIKKTPAKRRTAAKKTTTTAKKTTAAKKTTTTTKKAATTTKKAATTTKKAATEAKTETKATAAKKTTAAKAETKATAAKTTAAKKTSTTKK